MADRRGDGETFELVMKRIGVLRQLREGPVHKRDLVEATGQSRSTIDRAMRELAELDLVERSEEGVAATAAGRLAVEHLGEFQTGLGDILATDSVLDPLPSDAAVTTDVVVDSDAMLATEPMPYRPLERVHDALADADRYRAVLPALDDPRQIRLLYEHVVTEGNPAELVVGPELFATLREEFPRRITAMAEHEGFSALVTDELPPFALSLAEREIGDDTRTTVFVVVFTENGGVHGVLANGSPDAVRWAEQQYERAREGSSAQTEALFADTDGGTTGLDPDSGLAGVDPDGGPAVLGQSLPVSLEREGFVRPGVSYFRDEPIADPTTAWRAGLSLAEVHTGYAVERIHAPEGGADHAGDSAGSAAAESDDGTGGLGADMAALTATLTGDLTGGGGCVLVGPPGSGKSTLCKRVACAWYEEDRGPVLYREQGRGRPFESVDDLVRTVEAADGHALVVVEDAVRPETSAVFDAVERVRGREDVSFLFDARENEWVDPPEPVGDVPDLQVRNMPPLSAADCERLVAHAEGTLGESVEVPVNRLLEEVRAEATADEAAPSELLLLLHRLAGYADPLADGQTSLEEAVAALYDDLEGDDLALDLCLLVNTLNAAGLDLEPGALYAVAGSANFDAVDDALSRLEGRVLFPQPDGSYRTVHEAWSVAFLAHLLDAAGESAAARRFGDAVGALLSLADEPGRCERIATLLDDQWSLASVADDPAGWAAETTQAVYALGRERPKLAPLFGDGDSDTVTLPSVCPDDVADRRPVWLGGMFLSGGYYDRAERAFERLPDDRSDAGIERLLGLSRIARERGECEEATALAEECLSRLSDDEHGRARATFELGRALEGRGDLDGARAYFLDALEGFDGDDGGDRRRRARVLSCLGEVARQQGAYEEAGGFHRRGRSLVRDLGDRPGEAEVLHALGRVAWAEGEYERAREYGERALDIRRAVGDRRGVCDSFNMLGIVAKHLGEHDQAREYMERSLEIARELGMRGKEATMLGNLGLLAERQGEFDRAREAIEHSLEIGRELGKAHLEAVRLNNLGLVAVRQADHAVARDAFRQGCEIARERDLPRQEANAHNGLGHVARLQGRYEEAREHHEQGLAITREIGQPRRLDDSLNKLGLVAVREEDCGEAEQFFERALAETREIDHPHEEVIALLGLGTVARFRGDHDRAEAYLEDALERGEATGDRMLGELTRLTEARLALDCGEHGRARELGRAVEVAFTGMGARQWAARSRRLLGEVAAATGSPQAAREQWRPALETFEAVDAPHDALATIQLLAELDESGDDGGSTDVADAAEWRRRARSVAADAPPEVVERYRGLLRDQG